MVFGKKRKPDIDDDELEPVEDEENDFEYEEEGEPQLRPRIKAPAPGRRLKGDRYKVGYQKEILAIIDNENPDKEPEYYRESSRLLKYYPDAKMYAKELSNQDKLLKSVE